MKYIFFNSRDQLIRIEIAKIVYFQAEGNYTRLVMVNRQSTVVTHSLVNVENALASLLGEQAEIYQRVGRTYMVNRMFIYQVNIARRILVLSDFEHFSYQLPVSEAALKKIRHYVLLLKE